MRPPRERARVRLHEGAVVWSPGRTMTTAPAPHASIVVRSYNRLPSLCQLLAALLAQRCEQTFEIVVVEQSARCTPADAARLDALAGAERTPRRG